MELGQVVEKALEEAMRERGHINVLIAGRTGVGKSTLINAIFQGQYAATGQGRPVTQNTREITKEGIPLTIFDTRGLEMADFEGTLEALESLVSERSQDVDPNRHIHIAWLCIQEPGRRVEDAEIQLQTMLARHMPVIGVITKSMSDQGFRAEVQRLLPQTRNVVRVNSLETILDVGVRVPPTGLDTLVSLTMECVPSAHRRAFVAAQKASIELKVSHSHKIVGAAATAAATAGASPIPFTDAAILVPIQVGMIAGITATFGLQLSAAFISTLAASAAGTTAATFVGRSLVANLFKMFPGVGTAAGALINGTTAAALTTALGEAYILTLRLLHEESDGDPPSPEVVAERFKTVLQDWHSNL